jgi:hypothetical protein
MVLSLGWAWQPVRAVIVVAQRPAMPSVMPPAALDERFAGEPLRLAGYSLAPAALSPGEELRLSLFWQAEGPASRPYTVFNHLVGTDGQMVSQQDNWPVGGRWPPTCWREGDLIVDEYRLEIPAGAAPGAYRLLSGLYDAGSGERLLLADGRDAVELAVVEILEGDR